VAAPLPTGPQCFDLAANLLEDRLGAVGIQAVRLAMRLQESEAEMNVLRDVAVAARGRTRFG
jgi:hypothetical protein